MAEIEADLRPMNPEHAKMSRMWLRRSWRGSTDCRTGASSKFTRENRKLVCLIWVTFRGKQA